MQVYKALFYFQSMLLTKEPYYTLSLFLPHHLLLKSSLVSLFILMIGNELILTFASFSLSSSE